MNNTIWDNELLSDQFCDLRDKYGLPFVYDKAGKEVVGINQRFFAALYCQARNLLFDKDEKKFFLYDQSTGLWQEQSSSAQLCDVAQLIMQYVPNDYIRLSTSRMISQIQSFIKGLAEKRGAFQNKKKNVIHVANGILEFIPDSGWELRNPQPEDYSRNRSEITYNPESQCPQFLDQLLGKAMSEEDINLLQQYAGLVLLGYNLSQKVLLLTGSAGGGKSTLVNLIARLFDATGGTVKVDGTDVKQMSQKELRSRIGFVPQRGLLFSGTIASNIAFGEDSLSEEKMKEAADIACASEFIAKMDGGFNAPIAQGGTNVSGGQRQRLCIARAVATDPEIYVFDDSFSALDFKTDLAVRTNIREHSKEATRVIVAQRIGTIMDADLIIVLDEGKAVGMGTHEQLLKDCPTYRDIALSQLSKEELGL